MPSTYTSKYATGAAVDAALDKAESAIQPGADLADFTSGAATSGQVPTADGLGGIDWADVASGTGDVVGPASATDNAIARFDGTTGKLVQDSASATLADNGALTIATGEVTASQPILDLSQTWNDAAVAFTGIKANITNTASAAASNLLDLQVGGASVFKSTRNGHLYCSAIFLNTYTDYYALSRQTNQWIMGGGSGTGNLRLNSGGLYFGQNEYALIDFGESATGPVVRRDASNTLAQRNSTNAQTSLLYSTYTSATSYHRMALTCAKQTISAVSGATVATTGGLIPAGAFLMGVTTRVNAALGTSNGTTGYSVGNGTDANLWGDVTAVAAGTASKASAITNQSSGYTASDACGLYLTAQDITLTATGGNFDATGAIEISAFYFLAEAD